MGLVLRVEDEHGELIHSEAELRDERNILHKLLPSHDDQEFPCLRFVDWYGDTTFNYLQVQQVLVELERLGARAQTTSEHQMVIAIKALAELSLREPHTYLKFYGD
jgi:hypothetical protein